MAEHPPNGWACLGSSDYYQMHFPTKEAAIAVLQAEGEGGEVVRYERGIPREDTNVFDASGVITSLVEKMTDNDIIGDHESGLVEATVEQEKELERRLSETLYNWIKEVNPPIWTIVERESFETPTDAKNAVP